MSSASRLILFQTLSALPAAQFEELRFVLNPPPGIVPEGAAAQGNRVSALLSWVEGATGCGLEQLQAVLEELHPGILAAAPSTEAARDEAPWMVPYPRNPYFTGREGILAKLHRQLGDRSTAALSQTQAISGLGGIGKTQTAVEYAYRYRDDYRYVFWVRADTELELTNSYVNIAQTLNLPLKDAENQDETVQSVRVWLARETGWLLIFDNSDRPERVQPFLPREITGHILVTSRAQDLQDLGIVQPLAMETLSPAEAVSFLLRRTGKIPPTPLHKGGTEVTGEAAKDFPPSTRGARGDQDRVEAHPEYTAAAELVAELGYLPLALEQAAAYIVTNRVPVAAYLKSYRKQRLKRLEKALPKLGNYPDSIANTWTLNLKEVQKTAPAAAVLLNYCAFLHPDAIPFSLFTQGAAELGEPLATVLAAAADDPLELYDLLNPLCSYSLIRVEPESQSLSLHRLVQEVIRTELKDESCQDWIQPLFQAANQVLPDKDKDLDYQDWPIVSPLVNHVQELVTHCQQGLAATTEAADVLHIMGNYLLEKGQYSLAESLLRQALELRQNLLGDEHRDIAASFQKLGELEHSQGCYSDAESLYQKALAMRQRLLGNEHPDVATSLNDLAALFSTLSRTKEAESLAHAALDIRKKVLGNQHPATVQSLHWLAYLNHQQGNYDQVEPILLEVLKTNRKLFREAHPSVAESINNLACLYDDQERYEEAESLYQEALMMRKQLLGDEHPHVALSLSNLAFFYWKQKRYVEAEPLHQQALSMRIRLFGNKHPDVAASLNNLAALYRDQERYDEAESHLSEALQLLRRLLGNDHPNVGRVTENLGILYAAQKRTEKARSFYQQALAILETKLGNDHPWTERCRDNLAKLDSEPCDDNVVSE
ncbi:MAG: tetratricopeptide repeat protein [Cyanobacteria bacterium P01_H01_bin.152]